METVTLETQGDKFLISIDKNYVEKDFLVKLVEKIKLEHLVHKVNFDESIEDLGEIVKADWWEKNKDRFLRRKE